MPRPGYSRHTVRESIDRFFDYDIHVESRTIYLGTVGIDEDGADNGVDACLAERAVKALWMLGTSKKPINIILNNIGGDWYHGMAIYDAIKACQCQVKIQVYGSAMSMGSVILQAAHRRIMHPHSTLMVHDGYDGMGWVTPKTFEAWALESKRLRRKMYDIYAERSKKPWSYWEQRCANDYILSAERAVEEGLADEVIQPR